MPRLPKKYNRWPMSQIDTHARPALAAINADPRLPVTNNVNGKPDATRQKTLNWGTDVQLFTNDMCGFEQIPDKLRAALTPPITDAEQAAWQAAYGPTIETYDPEWEIPPALPS